VDWDLCQGHGTCVAEAPEVFALDGKGNLVVLLESPPSEQLQRVENAVRFCPSYALALEQGP
jgi:sterol 14-demethylase